jgi:hypothetical protein
MHFVSLDVILDLSHIRVEAVRPASVRILHQRFS